MPRFFKLALIFAWIVVSCTAIDGIAVGQQLSEEMQNIFEEMIPQMDDDLRDKLKHALKNRHDYIELTPDQFKRFRDHPSNPFEGWEGIDPDGTNGLIRLQFETEPIRSREPDEYERQATEYLQCFAEVTAKASANTLRVTNGETQIALGTVVSSDGYVLTKLSEIKKHSEVFCKTNDGQKFPAKLVGESQANDLALLKIEGPRLKPAKFEFVQPAAGAFVFSTDGGSAPMAMGVYSNSPRSLIGKNQAFLGVKPVDSDQGVIVSEVTAGSAAQAAGLKLNDILTSINGMRLTSVENLVNTIRKHAPGDKVIIEYVRQGKPGEVVATLAGRNVAGPTADRFDMMESFGAIPSDRRAEFPLVFQHDTPILPEQCGGPVVDLQGRVIGINIARGGRVASYAIPSNHLKTVIGELMRPNVASRGKDVD